MQVKISTGFGIVTFFLLLLVLPVHAARQIPSQTPEPTVALYLPAVLRQATPVPTNTPQPSAVSILSDRGYLRWATYHLFGEVINAESFPVCGVGMRGKFFNEEGKFIATDIGSTLLEMVGPGQRMPFELTVANPPTPITRYELTVTGYDKCSADRRSVKVVSRAMRDGPTVYGELYNDEDKTIVMINVAVTFYDAAGRIWYAVGNPASGSLEPGQTGYYSVYSIEPNVASLPFAVQAQGLVFEPWR